MEYEFDDMVGIDQLGLNYEAHVVGFDGESFTYSVYFENGVKDDNLNDVNNAINSLLDSDDLDDAGYIDVSKMEDKIYIYHDLGDLLDCETPVHRVLQALNNVDGIKLVLVNE